MPADLVARARDAGIIWIQQVMDCDQAEQALDAGADVIVAPGGEAGGHSGWVSTMVLVPQVVDVAGDVPVVAAGGSPTAAASPPRWPSAPRASAWARASWPATRCGVAEAWKQRIVAADALEAVKVDNDDSFMLLHPPRRGRPTPSAAHPPDRPAPRGARDRGPGRGRARVPGGGAGRARPRVPALRRPVAALVDQVLPAAEILGRTVEEAEAILRRIAATTIAASA